ncbi:MAG: bifunctional phosphoribosylaminoimidazolecarboxamide formyltransferase/IMP cyclohydrolase [Candidatus Diapherotrites archaeon]
MKVQKALISVYDKEGIADFARGLSALGVEIISTGGTAKHLQDAGIAVIPIEKVTDFPEILDGRLKTLHPAIHGGILAVRENSSHMKQLKKLGIETIDLVVINLYPFKEVISKEIVKLEDAIENIDIGGPTMLRAAAKNYKNVCVVTSPSQYTDLLNELKKSGTVSLETRKMFAAKVFEETAYYDSLISDYLRKELTENDFPEKLTMGFEKIAQTRYGENPHQQGALYKSVVQVGCCTVGTEQIQGKELSFNNYYDMNAALELIKEFSEPAVVIVKHANPCGVAIDKTISNAFKNALECDAKSAFGSIIALNRTCNVETAKQITSFFNEVVVAPDFDKDALDEFSKKKNLRVLKLEKLGSDSRMGCVDFKKIDGGILIQDTDTANTTQKELQIVSKNKPSAQQLKDLLFAWKVAKHVRSNAIVLAKNNATVGIGAGQMSRIDSTELAIKKANGKEKGAVLASDAFFPFRDNVDSAVKAGIVAIIQPGGSLRDDEVIQAVNEHKIPMVFTGKRHFRH